MVLYMHTLNGRPAIFDGDQICYAAYFGQPNKLAHNLRQIRKEQKLSKQWREDRGFGNEDRHSHIRVAP